MGIFAGCTPWGFHAAIAIALATILRLNRLWAFAASRAAILPVYLAIAFCEIEAGHLLRTGQLARLTPGEAFAQRYDLLTEWLVGTLLVGSVLAAAGGALAYALATLYRSRARNRAGVPFEGAGAPSSPHPGGPDSDDTP